MISRITTSIDMKRTGLRLQRLARQNGYSAKEIRKYLCLSCPQPVYRWYKGAILPSVDNLFFYLCLVKPVPAAVKLMPDASMELPYEGAKEMILVDDVDSREFLCELVESMWEELPKKK